MNWTTETKIKAGFALAVALLLAVAALAWHDTRQLAEDSRLVAHSYEVQDKLGDLLSELQDVETGARGYVITGKEEFLEPYERGRVQAGLLVEKLRRLLVDPGQQARLKALDPVVVEKIAQSGKVVELRRSQGLAAATAEVGKGEGKRLMDQIREAIAALDHEERLLLTRREQQTLDSERSTLTHFGLGVGIDALLLGFLFYSIQREQATRRQAEATLVREHELLRTVIDNLPGYIFVKDTAGRYLVSNRAHAQLLCGEGETHMIRKTAFDFLPEEAARAFSADDDAVMRTGQPVVDREETDEADGQRRWYRLTKVPLRGEHGQIVGLVGIKHDITAKKELESQFLRSQRMEAIGTLAGGVAHDLNNALAPILMATEFMRSRSNDADTEQLLDTVAACAQRGAGMVRQLLTFARGAEGEHGPVQLTHLIKEMASLARQTFPKNIEARTDYPPDLWTILGNPTQLHQVLLNLCVNARDAMPDGGTLTLAAANVRPADDCAALSPEAKPGPHMVLSVTDTGTGMTPEVRARLFEAFFTTKAPGVGTGLGLSTINGIVKEHGGFITVQSEVGRGTEFKVFLPAQTVAAAAPAAAAAASLPQGNGELILVVDDEPSVLNIATRMLTLFGYRVVTAKDGVDAVTAFIRQPDEIQLVITDMDMPTMAGPATIGALRNLAPKLKVIVSSGMSSEHHADALSVLRVKVFLHKPYSVEELLHAVHEVITGEAKATE